ncbi:MAG: GNAT family N-acetyltransferase [Betaproteobacteria bacterium]|nr:GNAT family N-acetyltransferase [Betaproteobacteria bacterium]
MSAPEFPLRLAIPVDAVTLAALSVQVFLDTYATEGVRQDLAIEAFETYSVAAFAERLAEPGRIFILAEAGSGLLGYAEVLLASLPAPAGGVTGAELVRLYVQPAAQRHGIGRALLSRMEQAVAGAGLAAVWLTAWEGNIDARAFYSRLGYADVGATTYTFQGNDYPNRVLARRLAGD